MKIDEVTVLVVDDMTIMRKIVIKTIKEMGFTNILEASDGDIAWKVIEEKGVGEGRIDFIISDWNMPNLTGLDLLQLVRKDERFSRLPFLMVTAEGEKGNVALALKAGVSNFVIKPFKPEGIKEKIIKILAA
jgi:two-component system chemotaxis response regulator CheY